MAYSTKTVTVNSTWTLVTNKVALLQFNDDMYMAISSGDMPIDNVGFKMQGNEKYVNGMDGISVWAKTKQKVLITGTVRVAGDNI